MMQPNENKKKRSRGGRPTLPDNERRIVRLQPAFTLNEIETLEQRAAALGIQPCEWLRVSALGLAVRSVPAINRAAYSELSKLASNINQIAHVANATSAFNDSDLIKTLLDTQAKVQQLRIELLGVNR